MQFFNDCILLMNINFNGILQIFPEILCYCKILTVERVYRELLIEKDADTYFLQLQVNQLFPKILICVAGTCLLFIHFEHFWFIVHCY